VTKSELKDWIKWIHLTSIPLRRFAPDESLKGVASGCLLNYRGRRFILTVAHVVRSNPSGWALEIGFDEGKGLEIYRPSCFLYLDEVRRGTAELIEANYCFAEVPLDVNPTFQHLPPRGPLSEKQLRYIFDISEFAEPDTNELYGFSGEVHPEIHGSHAVHIEPNVYPGLRYTKSEGHFHEFILPVRHPGHGSFEGCSGAPIVDTRHRLIALVSRGDIKTNVIYGVSITRYRFGLDLYCSKIRPA